MSSLRVRYQTIEFDNVDIHVRTLRDRQQFSDDDGIAEDLGISSATWPLFGIIWASGEVLAHLMFDYDIEGKRILEVGCGIGLTSLILNQRDADITATDHHPEAGSFLRQNVRLNAGEPIPFERTGWADEADQLGRFDLIIGSDLLYESEHAELLAGFIDDHARNDCEVIIVDPGRGQQTKFRKQMEARGYLHHKSLPVETTYLDKPFKGQIHKFHRQSRTSSGAT